MEIIPEVMEDSAAQHVIHGPTAWTSPGSPSESEAHPQFTDQNHYSDQMPRHFEKPCSRGSSLCSHWVERSGYRSGVEQGMEL